MLPSYTVLDFRHATLKLNDTVNIDEAVIQNSDQVNGNTDIAVLGGILDTNYVVNTNNNRVVTIQGTAGNLCSKILVSGIRSSQAGNASGGGIMLNYVKDCVIEKNDLTAKSDDSRRCGIAVTNDVNSLIRANRLTDTDIWVDYADGTDVCGNVLYGQNIRGGIWTYTHSVNVDVMHKRIYPASGYSAIGGNYGINIRMNYNRIKGNGGTANDTINLASMNQSEVVGNTIEYGAKNLINCDFPNAAGAYSLKISGNKLIHVVVTYWAIKIATTTITVPRVEITGNTVLAGASGRSCNGINVGANPYSQVCNNLLYQAEQNILLTGACDGSQVIGNVCLKSNDAVNPKSGIAIDGTAGSAILVLDNTSAYNAYGAYCSAANQALAVFRHNNFKNNGGKYDTIYGVAPTVDDNNLSLGGPRIKLFTVRFFQRKRVGQLQ